MSFCNNCGCSNPDSGLFCWKCGSKLTGDGAPFTPPEPVAEAAPVFEEPPAQAATYAPEEPAVEEPVPLEEPVPEAAPAESVIEAAPTPETVEAQEEPAVEPVAEEPVPLEEPVPEAAPTEPAVEEPAPETVEAQEEPAVEPAPRQAAFEAPAEPPHRPRSIDLGGPRTVDMGRPRNIDMGVGAAAAAGRPGSHAPEGWRDGRNMDRGAGPNPRSAPSGSFLSDPFNAKVIVMMCGIISIIIACYCLYGYKGTFTIGGESGTLFSIHTLSALGCDGILPSDGMTICIAVTMVFTVIGAIRAVPVVGGLAGIVTTALYYNVSFGGLSEIMGESMKYTISTGSLIILVVLWAVVIGLSVLQYIALSFYSESCEDDPHPLVGIWFGRL